MMTKDEISNTLSGHADLLRQYHIRNLWLFGSMARGDGTANDMDLLVEFTETPSLVQFSCLQDELRDVFGMPVDLVSRNGCRPRFLESIQDDLSNVA